MRIRRAFPFAFVLALSPLAQGCATILNGPNQTIHVETDPPGATVTVAGESHTSPVDLVLRRASSGLVVVIEKKGYITRNVPLERNSSPNTWINFVGLPAGVVAGAAIGGNQSSNWSEEVDNGITGLVIGALVVPGIMFGVDAATGSIHRLNPPFIAVKLEPVAPTAAPTSTP
jgi:hypothetical protein